MNTFVSSLLDLRIVVLALGEADHAGWWKSRFLSPVGLSFLQRIYPRSTFAAAVRSASRAARAVHDASIGKGAVFHLFRLPRQAEQEVEIILADQSAELSTRYGPLIVDRAALLRTLAALAGVARSAPTSQPLPPAGPIRLPIGREHWVPTMAATYHDAFHSNVQVFPYFETERADQ